MSNYPQHSRSSRSTPILRLQSRYSFRDWIAVLLHQFRLRSLTATMVDLQALLSQVDRRPDICAGQSPGNFPVLFPKVDSSSLINSADEMQASCGQRQFSGQLFDCSGRQFSALYPLAGFFHRQALQRRRCIVFIPGQKLRTLALKSCDRREVSLTPEALGPEMMDSFAEIISLRFSRRNEDQLDAQGEGQTNKTPENTRGSAQASEGRVVVDLQEVRHSQTSAGLQEMAAHRGGGLVSAAALRQSVSVS